MRKFAFVCVFYVCMRVVIGIGGTIVNAFVGL